MSYRSEQAKPISDGDRIAYARIHVERARTMLAVHPLPSREEPIDELFKALDLLTKGAK